MKTGIKSNWILVVVLFNAVLWSCNDREYISLTGKTMGTYYSIHYQSDQNYSEPIDSILANFISAASTYDSASEISEFNRTGFLNYRTPHLHKMLSIARRIHSETGGAFEPTLMPIINAYGFGYSKKQQVSDSLINSLLTRVSFNLIEFDNTSMKASLENVQLDLSAMGEGYAIDLISDFLHHQGIKNYKVEIGGEMKCSGKNQKNEAWLIGIENPLNNKGNTRLLGLVRLVDESISTSGTARKFYRDETGKKRSHIIHPKTGRPIENSLLSVTIKSKNAVDADAFATACMVMGYDSALQFIRGKNLEAFITYEENGKLLSWQTPSFFLSQDRSISLR
jgi:thiamine biosynthesis lipoprotein